jgi:hypothetical protein
MLRLPATPEQFIDEAIVPALALLPKKLDTASARLELTTIGLQESLLKHRWQVIDVVKPETKGPARGLLQFERGGGVRGVIRHPVTNHLAQQLCHDRDVGFDEKLVWLAMENDDILCAGFGRLLLLADPHPLPPVGEAEEAWLCYLRCWRPGAYERGTEKEREALHSKWLRNYAQAFAALH